jgi:1-acyl-sn-glycerol-3-phosphate acyltransferase
VPTTELTVWWRIGRGLLVPVMRALFRVRVEGAANVPREGGAILAFDHVSVLDGPCVAIATAWRCGRVTRFLVAAEVFDGRFGPLMRACRQIPIRRGQNDAHALDEAVRMVLDGALAAIAPEGRVSVHPGAELQRIRSGVARIALQTGAPVVPVAIWGTQRRWPRAGPNLRLTGRPRLVIIYGEPLAPEGDASSPADIDAFLDRVRLALEAGVRRAIAAS